VEVGGRAVLRLVDDEFGVLGGQQGAQRGMVRQVAAGVCAQFGAGEVSGTFQPGARAAGLCGPAGG
jgi:hypothetical protein